MRSAWLREASKADSSGLLSMRVYTLIRRKDREIQSSCCTQGIVDVGVSVVLEKPTCNAISHIEPRLEVRGVSPCDRGFGAGVAHGQAGTLGLATEEEGSS